MRSKNTELSPHSKKVLGLLSKSGRPMTAYDILDKLRRHGIKAPPTVYRALESLMQRGDVHRIESLNAFIACHDGHERHNHHARFAVCRACGSATEICDPRLSDLIRDLGKSLKFHIEREMLELFGLCHECSRKPGKTAAAGKA